MLRNSKNRNLVPKIHKLKRQRKKYQHNFPIKKLTSILPKKWEIISDYICRRQMFPTSAKTNYQIFKETTDLLFEQGHREYRMCEIDEVLRRVKLLNETYKKHQKWPQMNSSVLEEEFIFYTDVVSLKYIYFLKHKRLKFRKIKHLYRIFISFFL